MRVLYCPTFKLLLAVIVFVEYIMDWLRVVLYVYRSC